MNRMRFSLKPGGGRAAPSRHINRFAAVALLLGIPAGSLAQTSQPISTSLTECSVIFWELADLGERRSKPQDEVNAARLSAAMFLDEAFSQAKQEETPDAYSHVKADLDRLSAKWTGRFSSISLMKENKDWIDYCRSLGKSRKITLP